MSTTLLYRAFGIRGYEYRKTEFFEGRVFFCVEQSRERYRCPECGSPAVHGQGHKERLLQTIPIGLKPTFVLVKVPRVICFRCEHTRQVKVPFADPRRTYTHGFERYALELSKFTTIQDAARHLDVSWDIIKDIQKRNLERRDHFHVVKLYNDKLGALRRDLYRELSDQGQRQLLKGTRWLLLKNPENLDPSRNEKQRLLEALRLNTPLTLAYYLKEDLRQIWQQTDKATARQVLRDWIRRARVSVIPMLVQFARTMHQHRKGILAYYDYQISTGPLEGTNTKIQAMKRQAYGFRDHEFFKLKILAIHQAKYALVG